MYRKRILSDAEWNRVKAQHPPGTRVSAVSRRHVGFGVLCEIGASRIPAVMRSIEIDWDPVKQTSSTVPEGTCFNACVVAVADDWRELVISRKAADTSPFDRYMKSHKVNDIVEGIIHELTPTVIVVRLTGGLHGEIPYGMVPVLQALRADELTVPWGLVKGDCLKASIFGFDQGRRRVKLDLRTAVQKIDEDRAVAIKKWRDGEDAKFDTGDVSDLLITPLKRGHSKKRLSILLVDDESSITTMLAAALSNRGHTVQIASLYFEGDCIIRAASAIDVAVVDQQLPDGAGLELLRSFGKSFPLARRVLLTGNTTNLAIVDDEDIQVLYKPAKTFHIVNIVEGEDFANAEHRLMIGQESVGHLSQMSNDEIGRLDHQIRQVMDRYLGALQESFRISKIAVLRLQKSNNVVDCVRACGLPSNAFVSYSETLRFSFIGSVLDGEESGFFRQNRQTSRIDDRDPLRHLLRDMSVHDIYGQALRIESQHNPMAIFAFLPETQGLPSYADLREFQQTACAMALAIERATLDAKMFRHQRVMVAGSILLGMAHELRNETQSLTSTADYLEALLDPELIDGGSLDISNKRRESVARFQKHTAKLRDLVESALSVSRSHRDEQIPLRTLLEDTIEKCEPTARNDDVLLRFELDPDAALDRPVTANLQQVLMNLILNAIQHVRMYRPTRTGFVRISTKKKKGDESGEIYIRVEDNAFGLNWESRFQIFEPFYTTRSHGTGLGLNVARMLAEAQGGVLEVESSYKYLGTTMLLRLPDGV